MPSTKRPLSSAAAGRAERNYTIETRPLAQAEASQQLLGTRKPRGRDEIGTAKWFCQTCPFEPKGKFKTDETVDVNYLVIPPADWQAMTRYNSFVWRKTRYHIGNYVYVANEESVKRQRAADNSPPAQRLTDHWVARILEIRALDRENVFARIFWMYWPDELPAGTTDGRKSVKGRQPYHGEHELVASNHMDVIDAVSVTSLAEVYQWSEADDEDTQRSLYWRQALNVHTKQLSSARPICKCKEPAHPDKMLLCCPNQKCRRWMHDYCLRHDALMRVYGRLGETKPQDVQGHQITAEGRDEAMILILDPASAPSSISAPVPAQKLRDTVAAAATSVHLHKVPLSRPSASQSRASAARKRTKKEPYRGLFEATLDPSSSPLAWDVQDFRGNVIGGVKEWRERGRCLFCYHLLD